VDCALNNPRKILLKGWFWSKKLHFRKTIRGESTAVFGFCFNSHTASPGARGWHFNLLLIPGGGGVGVNLAAKATFFEETGARFYLTGMPYGRC